MKGFGICGIDPDRLGIIGDRILVASFDGVKDAAQIVGPRKIRIEPYRLAENGLWPADDPL
jgi:hypothetical protein